MGKEGTIFSIEGIDLIAPDQLKIVDLRLKIDKVRMGLQKNGVDVNAVEFDIPHNFLSTTLTGEQRKKVDNLLVVQYASKTVQTQELIAQVPIVETHEPFVFLPKLFDDSGIKASFSELPFHSACGEWAGKPREFWTRSKVGEELLRLGVALTGIGIMLHFEDGFRPVGVQEGLFKRRLEWTQSEHPDWDWNKILMEARSKTAITPRLASHKAGAAVDIVLKRFDGTSLDLGNNYPEGGALVALDCPYLTQEQWETRQIFSHSARMAGFAVYPGEDWHISLGDNLASLSVPDSSRSAYIANYGPIKSFDKNTGKILNTYQTHELDTVFDSGVQK